MWAGTAPSAALQWLPQLRCPAGAIRLKWLPQQPWLASNCMPLAQLLLQQGRHEWLPLLSVALACFSVNSGAGDRQLTSSSVPAALLLLRGLLVNRLV